MTACAYSPDGKRVLSASHDMTLREWKAGAGQQLQRVEGHTSEVTACVYFTDNKRVLSARHDDPTLREWDADEALREWDAVELRYFEGHTDGVTACAYSPDGKRVLSASWDTTLREWDVATGRELRRFQGHTGGVSTCAYSSAGEHAISVSMDATVKVWCISNAGCIGTVYGIGGFKCIAIAPHGIVAGDAAGNLWFLECDWF